MAHVEHVLACALKALLRLLEALALVVRRAVAGLHRSVIGVLEVLQPGTMSPTSTETAGQTTERIVYKSAGRTSSVRFPSSPSSDGSESNTSSLRKRSQSDSVNSNSLRWTAQRGTNIRPKRIAVHTCPQTAGRPSGLQYKHTPNQQHTAQHKRKRDVA